MRLTVARYIGVYRYTACDVDDGSCVGIAIATAADVDVGIDIATCVDADVGIVVGITGIAHVDVDVHAGVYCGVDATGVVYCYVYDYV